MNATTLYNRSCHQNRKINQNGSRASVQQESSSPILCYVTSVAVQSYYYVSAVGKVGSRDEQLRSGLAHKECPR